MNIEMAMLPGLVRDTERQVCIVVDVLRATTTLCALFERGVREVYLGADPTDVKAIAARLGDCLLAGERGGLAPEDFDFGNSPAQVLAADNLSG
ncbi:MAG: 2-phosphosulfolactate phosphatase, partial [Candidatus Chloroheliales bacterium]